MTQRRVSDYIRLNGTRAVMFCRWGTVAFGDVPDDHGLYDGGVDPVLVDLGAGDPAVVEVPVEGVLLVQGEESFLQCAFDGRFPSFDEDGGLLMLGQAIGPEGAVRVRPGVSPGSGWR